MAEATSQLFVAKVMKVALPPAKEKTLETEEARSLLYCSQKYCKVG